VGPVVDVDEVISPGRGAVHVHALADVEVRTLRGIDPDAGWHAVSFGPGHLLPTDAWPAAQAAARRALASELVGVSRAALHSAIEHVSSRLQFGRPLGSFQSVRHRLAESYAWIAAAETIVGAAHADGSSWSAVSAKAYAGRMHADVARHCTQVCGAMGLTWEHELPRMVRRGFLLDALHGSARLLTDEVGSSLSSSHVVPRVVHL